MSIEQFLWFQDWVNFAVVTLFINCQAKEETGACILIFDTLFNVEFLALIFIF